MLTKEEIRAILEIIGRKVVVEPSESFPYFVTGRSSMGYSDDPTIGRLQAKLSIMLEAARV